MRATGLALLAFMAPLAYSCTPGKETGGGRIALSPEAGSFGFNVARAGKKGAGYYFLSLFFFSPFSEIVDWRAKVEILGNKTPISFKN